MTWLVTALSEASTWNGISLFLGGAATYLGTNGYPSAATWIAAGAAGAAALAGIIIREAPKP